jgi:polyamine oxidase
MSTLFISALGALNPNEINRHQNQNIIIAGAQMSTAHSAIISALNAERERNATLAPKKNHHVVVVGAGISGLRTAAVLQRHGVGVTILEGRADRIGGRICTSRKPGKAARDIGKYT